MKLVKEGNAYFLEGANDPLEEMQFFNHGIANTVKSSLWNDELWSDIGDKEHPKDKEDT